jgi:hypothetical protein
MYQEPLAPQYLSRSYMVSAADVEEAVVIENFCASDERHHQIPLLRAQLRRA